MKAVDIRLTLPTDLAEKAEAAGLLTAEALERLIQEEVRRQAMDRFFEIADKLSALDVPQMTDEDVQAEIDAYRAEKRSRAKGGS